MRFHKLDEWLTSGRVPSDWLNFDGSSFPVIKALRSSQKFFMGDMDAIPTLRQRSISDFPNLPFGITAFEFEWINAHGKNAYVFVIAIDSNGWLQAVIFAGNPDYGFEKMGSFELRRDKESIVLNPNMKVFLAKHDMRSTELETVQRQGREFIYSTVCTLRDSLSVMNCTNVTRRLNDPPAPLQKKRSISKKPPLYSYWTLVLSGARSISQPLGGTHGSPRIHLRRGHIKRRKTGDFWWQPHAVGDRKLGVVMKDYRLKGQQ